MKQISMVYEAVLAGAVTSDQIAAVTGLNIPTVCNYLPELVEDGLIERTHQRCARAGRRFHRYAPQHQMAGDRDRDCG